ncbi:hypothetical protein RE428_23280 [Marinobacter nanhaiticus D15-8W]|uniref:J domain-containing protein n=1 Tax=Marinobacter nanhaiticus D15-8W TaxID=626887 RepID=N6WYQ7_9GAMM|nr:hypothetical protein [Marinobacter nanhaiticus]ENO13933.1 J domain-containing protein [Marinobacter nanhaiticus D15-8W]BES71310.1 hypothetical protein RE428_23280 [Marinobacter nanhaiticus D15-8W]
MTCWEVLGITPTNNPDQIRQAYESQRKFASGDSLQDLEDARDEALRQAGFDVSAVEPQDRRPEDAQPAEPEPNQASSPALNARDRQVVREVVIQVEAMLNDSYRRSDPHVWRAILTEPPADQDHVREAISDELYPRLKPRLDAGELPEPVVAFLAQWLGWQELEDSMQAEPSRSNDPFDDPNHRGSNASAGNGAQSSSQGKRPPMTNFWPAVIGWVAGLIILTSIFSQLLGS